MGRLANQQFERKIKMSHAAYRAGIASIAADEAEGEDVTARINQLASRSGVTPAMIRHEVTEFADLG